MRYENGIVQVGAGLMEDILNTGLRVLVFDESTAPQEGEAFIMEETNGGDRPTGRKFFARVMHQPDPQVAQIDLQAFMEDINPETGKPERFPMAGEYANEKHVVPESVMTAMEANHQLSWLVKTKGEKPIWMYRGIKWVGEYAIAELKFPPESCKAMQEGKTPVPNLLYLKVQGAGGEVVYAYELDGQA